MQNDTRNHRKKLAIGLSGGVDSAVAAYLLKEKGYDVTGVYIKCWEEDEDGCAADENRAYAVQNAARLGINFKQLDFIKEYKAKVIDYFYSEYRSGRTPNPDIMCNREIKFGLFFDWAMNGGFDYVAMGHYTRISKEGDIYKLLKGVDKSKDQSYFLYVLDQKHLSKTLFPVGKLTKKEVRKIAKEVGLPSAERPDSMGICFIGEVDIKEFLQKEIDPKPGKVVNLGGEVVGEHDGVWYYTIGQRRGFKISKYTGVPLYVVDKDVEKNELIVGEKKEIYKDDFEVSNLHWISSEPRFPLSCDVRIRHLGKIHRCTVGEFVEDSGKSAERLEVLLKKPIFGVAPGQSAVFYDGDVVLGGGVIV